MTISQNIKKYRKYNRMTQKELASKSGYSISYIKKIESLSNRNISIEALFYISKALEKDILHLLYKTDI